MFRNIIFITLIITTLFSAVTTEAAGLAATPKQAPVRGGKFDSQTWFIADESSRWTAQETAIVKGILSETIAALAEAGLSGRSLLEGYRFRRWAGEFAKDREGKIAVVNHSDMEIVLSDTILRPENHFYIYHELGHVVNRRSAGSLSVNFHSRIEQIDGIVIRHDWTTAEGFWFRGQAHINRDEAIADAFALWVWVSAGHETPNFHDTPETVQWDAMIDVFVNALAETF